MSSNLVSEFACKELFKECIKDVYNNYNNPMMYELKCCARDYYTCIGIDLKYYRTTIVDSIDNARQEDNIRINEAVIKNHNEAIKKM